MLGGGTLILSKLSTGCPLAIALVIQPRLRRLQICCTSIVDHAASPAQPGSPKIARNGIAGRALKLPASAKVFETFRPTLRQDLVLIGTGWNKRISN